MTRAVFPGTFDPIHLGHIDIAKRAAPIFDELVVAVYDRPLKSLLFSPQQRLNMVQQAFADDERIRVSMFSGLIVEFCHKVDAQVIVRGLRVFSDFEHEFRMALANRRLAPDIEVVAFITQEEHSFLTGTTVREIASLDGDVSSMVPDFVSAALTQQFKEVGSDAVDMTSLRD
ncbi:MAG: pantetheine-phosphate adenylyltransferase [Anaerolineales bacterium]